MTKQVFTVELLAAPTGTTERSHRYRKAVTDLFAGYGSMREVAEELGLTYIAVDVKGFMK